MHKDWEIDLWVDALGDAFDQVDLWDLIRDIPIEKHRIIADNLADCAESIQNHTYIPETPVHPLEEENARLRRQLAGLKDDKRILEKHVGKKYLDPSITIDRQRGIIAIEHQLR